MNFLRTLRSVSMTRFWIKRLNRDTAVALATAVLWQIANYAIPLATFPYLARVLEVRGFGILAVAMAVTSYALLVTDWGFNLTATQAIAQVKDDAVAINTVVWSTILARIMLGGSSCILVVSACYSFGIDGTLRTAILYSLLSVVASAFTIDWALRGTQNIRAFATASVLGRVASIPITYLLVRGPGDIAIAAFCSSLGSICTTVLTLMAGHRLGLIRRPTVRAGDAFRQILEGWHIFMSQAAVSLYTSCLALVLGVVSGPDAVGLFNGADRIRRPVQSLLSPIDLVFYPRLNALVGLDPRAARKLAIRILVIQSCAALALSLGLFVVAPWAIFVILGSGFSAAVAPLKILSLVVVLIGMNNVLGLMILLPWGMRRQFTASTIVGAVIGAGLVYPLSARFGAAGTASTAVLAELCVVIAMFFAARNIIFLRIAKTPDQSR